MSKASKQSKIYSKISIIGKYKTFYLFNFALVVGDLDGIKELLLYLVYFCPLDGL